MVPIALSTVVTTRLRMGFTLIPHLVDIMVRKAWILVFSCLHRLRPGPEDCGTVKPANVISTSYGVNEADLTVAYASRQCAEYAKLGLLGVTVLYSSGDYGVAGTLGSADCLNPDGIVPSFTEWNVLTEVLSAGSQNTDGQIFNPSFPSTCPYVTSVGATQLSPGKSVLDDEDACEEVATSGGGFSNYFPIPDYQKDAVSSYLNNNPPPYPSSIWNSTGNVGRMSSLSVRFAYVILDHFF